MNKIYIICKQAQEYDDSNYYNVEGINIQLDKFFTDRSQAENVCDSLNKELVANLSYHDLPEHIKYDIEYDQDIENLPANQRQIIHNYYRDNPMYWVKELTSN